MNLASLRRYLACGVKRDWASAALSLASRK